MDSSPSNAAADAPEKPTVSNHESFQERFAEYSRTLDCVHCGLCIPYCPTHGITGRESDSPRGRIYLMRGYAEGSIEMTEEANKHLEQCIVCRACETACPSGIHMGEMMESFREEVDRKREEKTALYRLSRFLLRRVLPSRRRIAFLSDLLWAYQAIGLRRLGSAILKRFSPKLAELDAMQPTIPSPRLRRVPTDKQLTDGYYPAEGKARMRVALFLGCIASEWFAPTHRATIRVLQKNGCDVFVPSEQTCCGALHRHGGFLEEGAELFARNQSVFKGLQVDALIVNAAGCGAALKEPPHSSADGLGVPVRDICEFLDEIGIHEPTHEVPLRVVYDQPCHLLHGQKVPGAVVERLLRQVPGLELLPLVDSDRCCGSGGVYNLIHPELAVPIRDEKSAHILAANPQVVVTGNPGCAMQIASGLKGTGIEVMHPVDVLDRAYGGPPS